MQLCVRDVHLPVAIVRDKRGPAKRQRAWERFSRSGYGTNLRVSPTIQRKSGKRNTLAIGQGANI